MIEAEAMLRLSCALLGLWGLVNSLHMAASWRQWREGEAGGWDLLSLRASRLYRAPILHAVYSGERLRLWVGLQVVLSLVLLAVPLTDGHVALLATFWFVTMLLALRSGADGADKMALVVAAGAVLQALGLLVAAPKLVLAGALWTGGQLTLAYATSGWSKLFLKPWRDGSAMRGALSSYMWGHSRAAAVLQHRGVALALGWAVIVAEILFPLALFAPLPLLVGVLAGFFLFHWVIAWLMGINTYPWAFVAAFPSALLLAQTL
jgi:hypothetical protein